MLFQTHCSFFFKELWQYFVNLELARNSVWGAFIVWIIMVYGEFNLVLHYRLIISCFTRFKIYGETFRWLLWSHMSPWASCGPKFAILLRIFANNMILFISLTRLILLRSDTRWETAAPNFTRMWFPKFTSVHFLQRLILQERASAFG